jgi:tRNA(Ile)-lysidine synthetase-like protein
MKLVNAIAGALDLAAASGLLPRGSPVLLAVSGGADSMALLYGAAEAARVTGWMLSVGHVHHGWRGREADRDLHFVEEHARRLALPFSSRHRDARAASRQLRLSPEAGARHVRYEALRVIAREMGARAIATAHQEDDVLESHLLARRRRGGLALLAGPRVLREDGVVRPLLSVSRAEVLRFLAWRNIAFRRDASNGDLRLLRNRVRREIRGLEPRERLRIASEVARLRSLRDLLERELVERIFPALRLTPGASSADAALLAGASADIGRAALERLAAPFARPGRPPMTGREREEILRRLAAGGDFRFEAGRRIRFERRGALLTVRPASACPRPTVYHSSIDTSTGPEGARLVS